MKKLITFLSFILLTNSVLSANEITHLENQGLNLDAMTLALSNYKQISEKIKFDEFVATVKSKVTNVKKEVITNTTYLEDNWNTKSFSVGLMAIFSKNKGSSSSKVNQTVWIQENSQQFLEASTQAERDFVQLKNEVKNYVIANKIALQVLKKLAAKAMQLSSKLDDANFLAWHSTLDSVYGTANYFKFSGEQIVLRCEVKKHAKTSSYENYKESYNVQSASDVASSSSSGTVESNVRSYTKSYKEKNCQSESKQTTVSAEAVLEIEFKEIDTVLRGWYKSISARYLAKTQAPEARYWGLLK